MSKKKRSAEESKPDNKKYTFINLYLPTRGRVDGLRRVIKSAFDLCDDQENVRVTALYDFDDLSTIEALKELCATYSGKIEMLENKVSINSPHLAKFYNFIYANTPFKSDSEVVSMVADDMGFETQGWDEIVLDKINEKDGKAVVWGDDAFCQHGKLAVHLFTTRKVIQMSRLPFMCERYAAYYIDTVWTDFSRRVGIDCYIKDLVIRHHHGSGMPSQMRDDTFQRLAAVRRPMGKLIYDEISEYCSALEKNYRAAA